MSKRKVKLKCRTVGNALWKLFMLSTVLDIYVPSSLFSRWRTVCLRVCFLDREQVQWLWPLKCLAPVQVLLLLFLLRQGGEG